MKKIFSLLCAAVLVMSASAMPVLSKAEASKMKLETATLVSKKDFKQQMATAKSIHRAPAVANAVYNIVCDSYNAQDYTAYDGDWYVTLQGNGIVFSFDIYTTTLVPGTTYTFADMEPYYTAAGSTDATDASFTMTIDAEGLVHVVASMTAGANTYNLTYDETPATEHSWGAWTPFAPKGLSTGDYAHTIIFNNPTTVSALDVQVRYATDEPTLAQVKVSEWGKGALSASGVDFIFEWNTTDNTCVVPEQGTGYNYQTYGEVMVSDISVWQGVNYYSNFPCTYNPATATFSLSLVYKVSAGTFGYSGDSDGNTAETLVMNSPAAVVTGDTIRYTIVRNAEWVDYAATQGWFQLYQNDDHYNVSISTLSSPLTVGEFFTADLDAEYTYIAIDGTKLVASDLHAVISKSAEVVTGILWVLDRNSGDVYEVTLTHDPSLPLGLSYDSYEAVDMFFATSDITTNSASGFSKKTISFRASNADAETINLTLYASSEDADIVIPEGVYTFASTKAAGTALISTGVSNTGSVAASYVATVDEAEGYLNDLWFLTEGTVTVEKVTIDEAPALYMEIAAKNSWGFDVTVTVGTKGVPTALENTAADAKATKLIENGHVVILRDGKRYNLMGTAL